MFPPKEALALEDAKRVAGELAALEPAFVSVTNSAGGSGNSACTQAVGAHLQDALQTPSVCHVVAQGHTRESLAATAAAWRAAGIVNVLALRGDPRPGVTPSDFAHASDMIPQLVEAGFCVGAAAYPEGHVTARDLAEDLTYLRAKQDAGASFLVTQLCFDNQAIYAFLDAARAAGITVPITVGIMPFFTKSQLERMVFMCGASMPAAVVKLLYRYGDDPAALKAAGVAYAQEQLAGLKAHGVDALHLYTMNKPATAAALLEAVR
jgi:methylenetetrahydrofolate reductase (NADPH)